jgi:secreted PhoX family phosphatase
LRSLGRKSGISKQNRRARHTLGLECLEQRSLLTAVPTLTSLAVSASSVTYGQPVTLTATVIAAPGNAGTPSSGSVTFMDGTTQLGSAALNSSGVATLQTTALPAGADLVTANFGGGGGNYAASSAAIGPVSIIATAVGGAVGDGGAATAAYLANPIGTAIDSAGNIFIADDYNSRIREVVKATGDIITVAGNGCTGYSGDNGPATAASFNHPEGVAVDSAGDIFIADTFNDCIREVIKATGEIVTVAGPGAGFGGDGGPATAAKFIWPEGIAVDSAGDIFIADSGNNCIREVVAATGDIIAVADAAGSAAYSGDGGPATAAALDHPQGVALDSAGDVFVADTNNNCIREVVAATRDIFTVAGNGTAGYSGDNGLATTAKLSSPGGVAVDSAGDIFIADNNNSRVREVVAATGDIATVAGNGTAGYSGDGGAATAASLYWPSSVVLDSAGDVFVADTKNGRLREILAATGNVVTAAGNGSPGDGGPATAASLASPEGVAVDSAGDVFIADENNKRIRELVAATGDVITVAGNGVTGYAGDGGPATAAKLNFPEGVAVDSVGDIFIADTGNNRIREVDVNTGVISTVAGNGTAGYSGDNGQATAAEINSPDGIAVDNSGHLFIADTGSNRIREVNLATGVITTVAGNGTAGYTGNNGQATAAELNSPEGVAVDNNGYLFLADSGNNRIREINLATGVVATEAGNGTAGYSGDNAQATAAELSSPQNITVDAAGNLFIADTSNDRIREVSSATGLITTVAGNGTAGYNGDNGQATAVDINLPRGIAITSGGNLFIADGNDNRVRGIAGAAAVSVAQALLTVSANNVSKVYGAADPTLTYAVTGTFYNGDGPSVVSGVALSTTTGAAATAGTHPITASGGTAANYAITFVPGTLTVLPDPTTPGLFSSTGSAFFLEDSCRPGAADDTVPYGPPGENWEPIVGDWTGDGVTTLGLYNPATSTFFLKDTNSAGAADLTFTYGPADPGYNGTTNVGWTPIAGDWNGDGTTTVGLYNPATGTFYLKNTNTAGAADETFVYGPGGPGWTPIAGDWNGDGTTTVGLYNSANGAFYLKDTNAAGPADTTFIYGPGGSLGWTPLAGVWNGSYASVGLYVPSSGMFLLKNTNSAGPADMTFNYGPGGLGWTPLVGSWIAPVGQGPDLSRAMGAAGGTGSASGYPADATGLTTAALAPIAPQAIARWVAAGDTRDASLSSQGIQEHWQSQWHSADLHGGGAVQQGPVAIAVDRAAADSSGFAGPAPSDDQELATDTSDYAPPTLDPRAVDQVDLSTVVEQELEQVKLEQVNR